MSLPILNCGFVPLVDCAPLAIAKELGFAAEEGLELILQSNRSWASMRDKLAMGHLDCAHLLAPMAVASTIGLGALPVPFDVLMILSVNGNVIGVGDRLDKRLKDLPSQAFQDAATTAKALIEVAPRPLTVGVPFPFSMHAELIYYWLSASGMDTSQALQIQSVPPHSMPDALAAREVDMFCVGEPYGSLAVDQQIGRLILPGTGIWSFAPEKVLAVRKHWPEENAELARRLMRSVCRAGQWLGQAGNSVTASEILARKDYLNISSDIIDRSLSGRIVINARGDLQKVPRLIEFFGSLAQFPWRSQAVWIAKRLAHRHGLDAVKAAEAARIGFRSDLYREHLSGTGVPMPGASEKLEGALVEPVAIACRGREVWLGPDRFFDGKTFDPLPAD